MPLTPEQIRFFRHNGFLKLPGCLSSQNVEALKASIWHDICEPVEPVVRDKSGRVVRISAIWDRAPIFRQTITCPQVLDPLTSLLGPDIEFIRNRHNHATLRLADDGGADYVHRDVLQWTRAIVTVLFFLEETTVENGCTRVIPGSHLLPWFPVNNITENEMLREWGILDQAVPVPMPAGGLLAIDSLIIHSAGKNFTDGTRISMTAGYHSVDELAGFDNPKRVLVQGERRYMGNDN